ncbi:type I restriction enzyme EcoKI subunit R [mine drainage metagenome]|uniref:Type I restriction enzyme EcoKI subunit R n=1 Tax=mine drainage metagenome TaxID=410659 RepID=A0A1J5RVU4_9ZZZZ
MSQFAFLKPEFAEVFEHAGRAESLAIADPRAACFYSRFALEVIVDWLYRHDSSLRNPYETTLSARIHEPTFRRLVGDPLVAKARIIKDTGNLAVHETRPVAVVTAVNALRELFHVSYWLVRTYAQGVKPKPALSFTPDALPRNTAVSATTLKQLQEAARRLTEAVKAKEEEEAKRLASEGDREKLEAEIAALRAEVAKAKAANAKVPDPHDYDEAATRDTFIDLLLFEAGWSLDKPSDREFPVTGMPNESGDGFVDYVLWGDDGKPLAVVEAKRTKRDARVGQQQAKLYADCLEAQFEQRPVIFYTNGYEHWIWDDRRYPPRQIQGFLTKDELELAIRRRTTLKPLAAADIDRTIVERFYQTRAIRRVGEAFEKDSLRRSLLVMATGAGKTRTVIALSDLLMRANWARRVLFLADRVALVNQAVNAFKRFLPSASPVNLVTEKDVQGRVYVSTYPTMMKLIDEAADGKRRFGPGHFDLIIIDEAHRSVYRKYGAIFDYFDSLLVGLTATPKDEVDRDTYGLFGLQRGLPTDAYGLDEAVKDGFLVPPKAVSVPLKFPREGIKYDDLPDEDKEAWDAIEWDEDGNVPPRVEAAAVNKWLFNTDTIDKVLEHLMTHGLKVAEGDRLGKTIIFAKTHDHAQFIVERFDANYPHFKGAFARVIDFKTEYAQSLIDDFSVADKAPHIAVSVDMLDTGIDVPEVVNLVFFKIVRSKTKFWQMIGRGTRLSPDLFGPGRHKESFSIFDFCQNFEFFNQNPDLADGTSGASLAKQLFAARVELIGEVYGVEPEDSHLNLREALVTRLREEIAGMSLDNFLVRPKRRLIEKYADDNAWKKLDFAARAELIDEIAGLPTCLIDDDIAAKQFDLLVLKTELAVIRSDKSFDGLRKKIVDIAGLLEEMSNVPMVAAEMVLIHDLQADEFWQDITLPMLENVRTRLRGLIKLIEVKKRTIIYTNFEDEIGQALEVAVKGVSVGTDMDRFRLKARHFLKSNENHIAVLRLRRNEPLTITDLAELERFFVEAGIAVPEDVDRLRAKGGLGVFVRSIVGLDREAAKRAFDQFTVARTLTANQIEFLNMVIDHLTERGIVEPELLYESPFTDLDPLGVAGVFGEGEVIELIGILNTVRDRAAA